MAMPFKLMLMEKPKEAVDVTSYFVTEQEATSGAIQLTENTELMMQFTGNEARLYADFLTEHTPLTSQDAIGVYAIARPQPYVIYAYANKRSYPLIAGDYYLQVVAQGVRYYARLTVQPKRMTKQQFARMRETLLTNARELAMTRSSKIVEQEEQAPILLPLLRALSEQPRFEVTKGYGLQPKGQGRMDGKAKRLGRQKPYRHLQPSVQTLPNYDIAENRLLKHWLTQYSLTLAPGTIKQAVQRCLQAPWLQGVAQPRASFLPRVFFSAGLYGAIYQALQQTLPQRVVVEQDHFRRTDELYELWGFIKLAQLTEGLGYTKIEEVRTAQKLTYTFMRGSSKIYMVYDELIPRMREQSSVTTPLYTLQNNRPDCRIDLWKANHYAGSLIVDFKYRHRDYIWEDEVLVDSTLPVPATMLQLEAYSRNMRTAVLSTTTPAVALQPVHEVWALYPLKYEGAIQDERNAFMVRLMDLSPCTDTSHISQHLEHIYTKALG